MPTEQEARTLREAIKLGDEMQAHWREDDERDPGPVYAKLLKEREVPVSYLLHVGEKLAGNKRHKFILILDKPDEAVLSKVFGVQPDVMNRCGDQEITFEVKQTYGGTEKDVGEFIRAGYAIVQATDQGRPES